MISRKLFGPPGTGKTTKLLKYVKTFLKLGTPINKIGYFAFTTKAANEAVDRMLDYHTAFERKDLKHFRTLHSFAFNQLGMKKAQVMQDEHYEDIGKKLGIEVTVYSNGEESTGFINSDSEYFNLINAARIKNIPIEEEYNTDMYSQDMDKRLLQIISDEVNNYKQAYGLVDFTDMIEKFIVSKLCPNFDITFIDEAQDLSPIQWKMVDIITKNSKYIILAGDDDQAIYGWAGADVKKFQQKFSKKDIILPQSYRVPLKVQDIADKILNLIPDDRRIKKQWQARKEVGDVSYVCSLEDVPLDEGNWLVLARYNDKLNRLKPFLKERGIYFEYKDRKSYKVTLFRTILNYIRWQKGSDLSLPEVKDIFEYTNTKEELTEERMYNLEEFGYDKNIPWYDEFTSDYEECLYIREMLSNGEELRKDPRVKLSTIHSAKGGEADNVLLILDNTKTIRDALEKNSDKQDEEHRVWYVGVTRTKQNLYIMAAKKEDQGYDIESLG
ncbi:ATP-dependent helicase [Candidatus Pelagibacter sp.]|nr:ATP-dependent helicase [Candidatus Pelagibacter sp.]